MGMSAVEFFLTYRIASTVVIGRCYVCPHMLCVTSNPQPREKRIETEFKSFQAAFKNRNKMLQVAKKQLVFKSVLSHNTEIQ